MLAVELRPLKYDIDFCWKVLKNDSCTFSGHGKYLTQVSIESF